MEELKKTLKDLGNPYHILELDEKKSYDKKEVKAAYKAMALKYHPDKNSNDDAQERFHKIKLAYNLLSDPSKMKEYEEFKQVFVDQQKRVDEMTSTQRKFYDDLLKREQEYKEKEEERKKDEMKNLMKRQEKLREQEKERAEEERQKQQKKEEKLKQELGNQEFHTKINSIKVKWSKKQKVSYNEKLLNMQFRQYGPIKSIIMIDSKRSAVIEFMTATAAENAVKDHKSAKSDSDDSDNQNDADLQIQSALKVKFLLKEKERNDMINMIEVKTKETNKPKDFSLNTNNLNKIADILSRGSSNNQRKNIISSNVSELKRQQERKRFMEEQLSKED